MFKTALKKDLRSQINIYQSLNKLFFQIRNWFMKRKIPFKIHYQARI